MNWNKDSWDLVGQINAKLRFMHKFEFIFFQEGIYAIIGLWLSKVAISFINGKWKLFTMKPVNAECNTLSQTRI